MIPFELIRSFPASIAVTLVSYDSGLDVPPEVAAGCRRIELLPFRANRLAQARTVVTRSSIGAAQRETAQAKATVRRLSREADVTLIHGPHVMSLAQAVTGPMVLQVVDPWSLRVGMEISLARGGRAVFRRHKARQALQVERRLPARARLLTVGRQDAETWSRLLQRPVRAVANGTEVPSIRWSPPEVPTACFVGGLGYGPNIESARILIEDVAPRIWRQLPSARFVIAGRSPHSSVLALAGDRVEVRPDVASVAEVFAAAHVAVFPDQRGLGVRNSVREALNTGVPVVATAMAAREQGAHPQLTVADDLESLAGQVLAALQRERPAAATPVSQAGSHRSWAVAAADYVDECRAALGR